MRSAWLVLLSLVLALCSAPASKAAPDSPSVNPRDVPAWARDAVPYEVFPRAFSPAGDLDAWGFRVFAR